MKMRSHPVRIISASGIFVAALAIGGCTAAPPESSRSNPLQGDSLVTELETSVNQDDVAVKSVLSGDATSESTNRIAGISGQGPFSISLACTGGELIEFRIDNEPLAMVCDSTITKIDNVQAVASSDGLNIDLSGVSATPGAWAALVTAAA